MIIKTSTIELVFVESEPKAVNCMKHIIDYLTGEYTHSFSVSKDHIDGRDCLILTVEFSCSYSMKNISEILEECE